MSLTFGPGLAFVDTETTGLDPDVHEIWEVALVVPGEQHRSRWLLPVDLGRADPAALRIGRFHERWSDRHEDFTHLAMFAREFAEATRGCHLVGMVPSFDEERLRKLLRANGACPEWHYHLVDVEAMVAGLLGLQPPWDSNDLSLRVGVDPNVFDRHTAMGDVEWALAVYGNVVAWHREAP